MKGKGPRRDLERERVWRAVLVRQRQSGLSIREFCRRETLAEVSFYAWRRELLRRDRESASVPHPSFEVPHVRICAGGGNGGPYRDSICFSSL